MPMLSSAPDQIPRFIPSHVGSWVLVIAFSSMVLKMEQIVALKNWVLAGLCHVWWASIGLRDTEQEDDADTQLCPLG
jgi:hypothetical protein